MFRPALALAIPVLLSSLAASASPAACPPGQVLKDQAWAEPDPHRRIDLLRQSSVACPEPDPATLIDLATACLGVGDRDGAIAALEEAGRLAGVSPRQVDIQAKLARLDLEQGRLGEASAHIGLAIDLAGDPTPPRLLELRRAIDAHPGRSRLDAEQITRGLDVGSSPSLRMSPDLQQPRGFAPQPRLDLYVLFDFDQDRPNAEGLAQVQELAKALVARAAGQRYRLIGHTDTQGGATYKQGLSERRATSVRRLVEDQTRALNGRILAAGRGESEPKHPGNDEESHRLNRRVELEALPEP